MGNPRNAADAPDYGRLLCSRSCVRHAVQIAHNRCYHSVHNQLCGVFSEIYRGGIESIPVGQYEAGQVLGLTKTQTFFKVVLFQVVKRIMAPMSNEVITLVKDTSLANVIAVGELIMSAQNIVKVYAIIWPLFYTAIFYLIFCGVLTLLFNALEKKLNYYRG